MYTGAITVVVVGLGLMSLSYDPSVHMLEDSYRADKQMLSSDDKESLLNNSNFGTILVIIIP